MLGFTVEHCLLQAESEEDLAVWTMNDIISKKCSIGSVNYLYATKRYTKHVLTGFTKRGSFIFCYFQQLIVWVTIP